MKKVSVLFFLALLLLIPACKKGENQVGQETESQEGEWASEEVEDPTPATPSKPKPTMKGGMISGWYYDPVYEEDGVTIKTMSADFEAIVGTEVEVYGFYDAADENKGAEMLKEVPIDGAKKDFIHVRYDGEDYYVRDYSIAVDAVAAVVMNSSAYIYSKPDLANIGKNTVPESTIVAAFSEKIPEDEEKLFKKIRYYVPDGKTFTVNGYLMNSSLSFEESDVAAVMVSDKYKKLRAEGKTDPIVLEELMDNLEFLTF